MVLYFSATGNTEFIAREIASRLGDECVNLLSRVRANDLSPLESDRPYVICAPVYVCEMPRFMAGFLKKLPLLGSKEVYFIFTSGGYCGPSGVLAKRIVKSKHMVYRGCAEFKMPRNYIASDSYPMLAREETERRIRDSYARLDEVASGIREGARLRARHVFLFETLITLPINPYWCKRKLTAKDFYATDACIGCGKCERLCPLGNVSLTDGKPVWSDACTHCMACIANCPTNAIEYGNVTQGKERYVFSKYRYVTDEIKANTPKE